MIVSGFPPCNTRTGRRGEISGEGDIQGRLLISWDRKMEFAAGTHFGGAPDLAAVLIDKFLAEDQSQACSGFTCRSRGFVFLIDAE